MPVYHLAGQDFIFFHPVSDLEQYRNTHAISDSRIFPSPTLDGTRLNLISRTSGWVGNTLRTLDIYTVNGSTLLRVEEIGDFVVGLRGDMVGKAGKLDGLSQHDRNVILGPVLVYALAERDLWPLHASAAMFHDQTTAFVGESGTGKSTLAAYLSQSSGWRLVADDILPVKIDPGGVWALPHFPQLKLPMNSQPGPGHAEMLPLSGICLLMSAESDPELEQLPANQAARVWLSHTAGTRLFAPGLLAKHLEFCTQAAGRLPVYRLTYPRRLDALPVVKDLLEGIC